MPNAFDIVFLVGYGLIFLTGSVLNITTMYVLALDKVLRKKLASVRWLMLGESFSEFMICFVAVPFVMASTMVGDAPPFNTVPFLCGLTDLIGPGGTDVSYWYQAAIALTRLAAVVTPNWYRTYVRNKYANAVLFVLPWVITYSVFAVSALEKAYIIGAMPETGACLPQQYDNSTEAADRYAAYLMSDTFINVWAAMAIGLGSYMIIYSYKWWGAISKKIGGQVQPTQSTSAVAAFKSQTSQQPTSVTVATGAKEDSNANATAAAPTELARTRKTQEERDKKLKLLATACVVSIVIVFPCNILYSLNYFDEISTNAPVFANLLQISTYVTFPLNPIMYLLVSNDFREAYRRLFNRH